LKTFNVLQKYWFLGLLVAALQNAVAVYAVYSSYRDPLSDGACIGGVYGTLTNIAILVLLVTWLLMLAVKNFRSSVWDKRVWPLATVAISCGLAIMIGQNAMLRCTV
jgi:hypothetical protein